MRSTGRRSVCCSNDRRREDSKKRRGRYGVQAEAEAIGLRQGVERRLGKGAGRIKKIAAPIVAEMQAFARNSARECQVGSAMLLNFRISSRFRSAVRDVMDCDGG